MYYRLIAALLSLSLTSFPALAAADHSGHTGMAADRATSPVLSEGEVRKIDKEAGKITLKHGELKNLEMPAMTMVFRVKDPAMLDQVKVGDKIRFMADKINGALTVTMFERAK